LDNKLNNQLPDFQAFLEKSKVSELNHFTKNIPKIQQAISSYQSPDKPSQKLSELLNLIKSENEPLSYNDFKIESLLSQFVIENLTNFTIFSDPKRILILDISKYFLVAFSSKYNSLIMANKLHQQSISISKRDRDRDPTTDLTKVACILRTLYDSFISLKKT